MNNRGGGETWGQRAIQPPGGKTPLSGLCPASVQPARSGLPTAPPATPTPLRDPTTVAHRPPPWTALQLAPKPVGPSVLAARELCARKAQPAAEGLRGTGASPHSARLGASCRRLHPRWGTNTLSTNPPGGRVHLGEKPATGRRAGTETKRTPQCRQEAGFLTCLFMLQQDLEDLVSTEPESSTKIELGKRALS